MKKLPMEAKFIEKENLHLTVTFIGEVVEEKVEQLKKQLDMSVEDIEKFHVKLKGLKIIPSENFIRVIGIGVEDKDMMKKLVNQVSVGVGGKFHDFSKLTLCRVKRIIDKNSVKVFLSDNVNVEFEKFEINSIALVKSTLTKKGPIYETIHKSVLK